MVWIDNHAIDRQYFPDITEARRQAILWLENNVTGKTGQVFFYPKQTTRNSNAQVVMEKFGNEAHFYWKRYTKAYGVVQTPLYKNGKLMR